MAFDDNPVIDQYAKNEEKSEWRIREFLNQETGFICRREVPDKGCDLDVELILEGEKSSSWKFPIQLKSIEKLKRVNKGEFISLSFETSRLGYLMRRIPAMGLVVFYSVEEDKCFYEYADKIYGRLMEERESDKWKKQDSVNIHIPYANLLNEPAISGIHKIFTYRFDQAMVMQNSHGEKYGLPTISLTSEFKYDFHNPQHIKKFLSEYGILLLNNHDLEVLFQMVSQLTNFEIYRDKALLLVAAVTYAESGLHSESQVFCNKLRKLDLSQSEDLTLSFVKMKNDLALGYITTDEFIDKLKNLDREGVDEQNAITLEINLTHFQLSQQRAFQDIPASLVSSIENVFSKIEQCKSNHRTKGLLRLWNSENLSYLISSMESAKNGEMRIKKSLGKPMSLNERKSAAEEILKLENRFHEILEKVNKDATEKEDKFLKAYSFSLDVKHFIHHHINYYSFDLKVNRLSGFDERVKRKISYAANAYNDFLHLGIYKEAYDSLCNMLEVIELATEGYGIKTIHDKAELYRVKDQMEAQFDFSVRPIAINQLIERKRRQNEEKDDGMAFLKDLDDEQIEGLARMTLQSFDLKEDRLVNIIEEMKAYRLFHTRCQDSNIEILQLRTSEEAAQVYAAPVRFILRSKSTGIQTSPSSDMNSLLSSWGL